MLVFSFVTSDTHSLPCPSEQRCLSPNKDAARHQAHLPWGCRSLGLSPPAALPPVMSRSLPSALSGAETRVVGWASGGVGATGAFLLQEMEKSTLLSERSCLGQEERVCRFSRASRIHCFKQGLAGEGLALLEAVKYKTWESFAGNVLRTWGSFADVPSNRQMSTGFNPLDPRTQPDVERSYISF